MWASISLTPCENVSQSFLFSFIRFCHTKKSITAFAVLLKISHYYLMPSSCY